VGSLVEAVVLDIGSVLEVIDDTVFPGPWCERLGVARLELMTRLDACLAGDPGLGEISEAELRGCWQRELGLTDEDADGLMATYWRWYAGELDVEMTTWFAGLRDRGLVVGILSNSCSGAREAERHWGFEAMTDDIVYSHEVGLAKPDPAVYALTAERLGVRPEAIAFLDDVPANVGAARACGWQAVLHESTPSSIRAMEALLAHRFV
jgi:HAD superfamily hydrolase (TIGR01509 family)